MGEETRHFDEELAGLKSRLIAMGGLAEDRVRAAVLGLMDRDAAALARVVAGDAELNALHMEVDDRAFKMLALFQPMAVDLRVVVSAIKLSGDLERVGDLAVNIAEAGSRCLGYAKLEALADLPRMGGIAQLMLREALDAFVRADATLAGDVLKQDDVLDGLRDQVFRELLAGMLGNPRTIEPGTNLILVARHLERIGDHATNIAEDVIFIVKATDVRHHAADLGRRRDA